MSDFEDLVRQTGFLLKTDVGQGAQDLVLTVSTLGLTGTQVASLKEVEAAGFVKADRLDQAEALLARTQAKLKELDANHTALRGDHARKLEAIARTHEAQLAELNASLTAERDEAQRAIAAQVAAAQAALAARQDAWGREKEALEDAFESAQAARQADREVAADTLAKARLAFEAERRTLQGEIQVWEARQRAEREGIQARNDGAAVDATPYGTNGPAESAAHQAWRGGWTLRDGLLRLNDHAHQMQAERDQLMRAMEKARPEVERMLEENQRLTSTAEALRRELVRVNAEHDQTQQALEACQAQLRSWREEG
jgi:chromosome segregation ATPase